MWRDTGGSAFPTPDRIDAGQYYTGHGGMSMRQWYAGQALAAAVAGGGMADIVAGRLSPETVAEHCFRLADAMIVEQQK